MFVYSDGILKLVEAVCSAVRSKGWSVDMIVEFGSHARGEARPDSDYDINLYVHRDGWLYLFEEYARRLEDSNDEAYAWHRRIRDHHFQGYQELSAGLEHIARDAVVSHITTSPAYILNVFDTRLMLFNLPHETWPLFELVGGVPLSGANIHEEILAFLFASLSGYFVNRRSTHPFHRRTVDIHLMQCELAKLRAIEHRDAASAFGVEATDARRIWLSSIATYLRNLLSILSLLTDGWFIARKDDVLNFALRVLPNGYGLMEHVYRTKCDPSIRTNFLSSGCAKGEMGSLTIVELHQWCEHFGVEIHRAIADAVESRPDFNVDESEWLPINLAKYDALPIYRSLVGLRAR